MIRKIKKKRIKRIIRRLIKHIITYIYLYAYRGIRRVRIKSKRVSLRSLLLKRGMGMREKRRKRMKGEVTYSLTNRTSCIFTRMFHEPINVHAFQKKITKFFFKNSHPIMQINQLLYSLLKITLIISFKIP